MAVKIGEERYVLTVTLDKSASQKRLRKVIRGVVDYILENGPLEKSGVTLT